MFADRLPQFQKPQAVGVVGLPFLQGAESGLLDAFRRVKIGLADFEMNDIFTLALHRLGGFQNIHDDEGGSLPLFG